MELHSLNLTPMRPMGKQFIDIVRHSSIKVGGCSTIFLEDLRRRHPFSSYYTTLGDAGRLERPEERSEHTNTSSLYARPPPRPTSGERMHAPAWPTGRREKRVRAATATAN